MALDRMHPPLRLIDVDRASAGPAAEPQPAAGALSLEQVFRAYAPYVASIGLKLLGRDDELDDLVQEVFLSALGGLRDRSHPAAVKGWLATVTVRMARRRLRVRRLKSFFGFDEQVAYEPLGGRAPDPEQRALLLRVARILDELPVDQRIAWTLRHVEGEQLDAVAELCGCSLATAKRRIAAAQAFLEKAVSHG